MGLDMYLTGTMYHLTDWKNPENNKMIDGYPVKETHIELGYWRKHPDLHGYIVETFADGEDKCQDIDLAESDLEKIIEAIKAKQLPKTQGFFFGESTADDDAGSIDILTRALAWLRNKTNDRVSKGVVYRASW